MNKINEEFLVPLEFEENSKALFAKDLVSEREYVDLCLLAFKLIESEWDKRQGMAYRLAGLWLRHKNLEENELLDQIGSEFDVLELPDKHAAGSEEGVRKHWAEVEKLVKEADKTIF